MLIVAEKSFKYSSNLSIVYGALKYGMKISFMTLITFVPAHEVM
jgi:hypothetical protein